MNRRDAIRLLATSVALPMLPGSTMTLLREARVALGSSTPLRTLNPHQEATVKAIAEMILPRTDTPGANDVGACEFIDLILTEWYDESERGRFLAGLDDADGRSRALFGKDFVGSSAAQQTEILIALGDRMKAETEVVRNPRPSRGDWSSRSKENPYSMLRRLTLTAYYTSEAGATQELHYEVIPDHVDSCAEQTKMETSKP